MLNYLPVYERKSKVFQQLIAAEQTEILIKNEAIEDFKLQLDVDTATWGLDYYEKELKIKTDYTKPYAHRRSVIKSKWRTVGKCDRTLIKLTADAYTNGDVEVAFNGRIVITFTSVKGIPPNMSDLQAIMEEIKPAHKMIEYEFIYTTWGEVKATTWGNLKNHTWGQVKVREWS